MGFTAGVALRQRRRSIVGRSTSGKAAPTGAQSAAAAILGDTFPPLPPPKLFQIARELENTPQWRMASREPILAAASGNNLNDLRSVLESSWPAQLAIDEALCRVCLQGYGNEALQLLLLHGAAAEPFNVMSHAPLYVSCGAGKMGIVEELLRRHACVDTVSPDGDTALSHAAFGGHAAVVKLLLDHGAHPLASQGMGELGNVSPLKRAEVGREMLRASQGGDWDDCIELLRAAETETKATRRRRGRAGSALVPYFWHMIRQLVRTRPYVMHWYEYCLAKGAVAAMNDNGADFEPTGFEGAESDAREEDAATAELGAQGKGPGLPGEDERFTPRSEDDLDLPYVTPPSTPPSTPPGVPGLDTQKAAVIMAAEAAKEEAEEAAEWDEGEAEDDDGWGDDEAMRRRATMDVDDGGESGRSSESGIE